MATSNFGSFFACLLLVGGCIYMKYNFTPHPLHEAALNTVIKIAIFIFSVIGVVRLYFFLKNMQFAIMDEKGIQFKSAFGKLGFVPWAEIERATIDKVWIYKIMGFGKRRRIKKMENDFYVIVSTAYYVYPSLNLNPRKGGIARTIPAPDSRFEEQLYFYRPDLKPQLHVDEN